MSKPAPTDENERDPKEVYQEKKREEKHHEKAVEDSFPASDPPATAQPGSGITGLDDADKEKLKNWNEAE